MCRYQEELKQLGVAVILVSFGSRENGRAWLAETCPSFQLVIDSPRDVYRSYRLKHSWGGSWNLKTLAYYLRALLGGREWHGIVGDPAQLGGDFIIARDGRFLFEYRSRQATDRPQVSRLMDILREPAP